MKSFYGPYLISKDRTITFNLEVVSEDIEKSFNQNLAPDEDCLFFRFSTFVGKHSGYAETSVIKVLKNYFVTLGYKCVDKPEELFDDKERALINMLQRKIMTDYKSWNDISNITKKKLI